MIPKHIRKKLPRAKLISIKVSDSSYWAKFRLANAIRWQLWRICITHRAPWIERSARQIHPHLFNPH